MITNAQLIDWINTMPEWVRRASGIFFQKGAFSDDDIKSLVDCCLIQSDTYTLPEINILAHGVQSNFSIKCIKDMENVNALSSEKPLEFGEKGVTVVYGLNGAGKSGYIRILKMASAAKYREDIKGNVFSAAKGAPYASINILCENGTTQEYRCNLKNAGEHNILRGIDIFDTRISNAYVSEAKEASYEPWVFTLFTELANVALRIKNMLEAKKEKLKLNDCLLPEKYSGTASFDLIKNISAESNIADFPAVFSDTSEQELQRLVLQNQTELLSSKIEKNKALIKNINIIVEYFKPFETYFSDSNFDHIRKLHEAWKKSIQDKDAAALLFTQNSDEIDANSVSIDSWRNLWKYARLYYHSAIESTTNKQFAEHGSICPLCRQPITRQEAVDRFKSIDSYVNGKVLENEKIAFGAFRQAVQKYPTIKDDSELLLLIEAAGLADIAVSICELHESLKMYAESLNHLDNIVLNTISITPILHVLHQKALQVQTIVVQDSSALNEDSQATIRKRILELEATKLLVSLHDAIEKNIKILQQITTIDKAIRLTATNRITTKSRELAEELITAEYIQRFQSELKTLTNNTLSIKLLQQRAGRGKTPYKVVLYDVNDDPLSPQDILSEGENRVASLAAFFAEATGRYEIVPMVVDDPISSLDYEYESRVIGRLVDIAKRRQVIVFTHRISLVVGLNEEAKKEGVEFQEITLKSTKQRKGVPADNSSIGGKVKAQLNELINTKLSKLRKTDELSDEYPILFHNICQDFRNIVEKSVEDILIAEVVKRFRRDVQTKNRIDRLAHISEDDCKLIDELMTKYSYYDHSMSDETPLIEMDFSDLENDLKKLQSWIQSKTKN